MEVEIIAALRETMWRRTEPEEKRFLEVVESLKAPLSGNLVRALFDTFLPIDDYGTQESVVERLTLATDQAYFDVLSDEIANIAERAPDWADDMLLRAAIFEQSKLVDALVRSPEETTNCILRFMRERLFDEPEIRQVSEQVEAKRG